MVERDSKETSLLSIPGKWNPAAWTMYPVVASMAIRECFNSEARNHARVESDPKVARLRGSNGPTGLVFPGKSSRAWFKAELVAFWEAGAKAAAEPANKRTRADFIIACIGYLLFV